MKRSHLLASRLFLALIAAVLVLGYSSTATASLWVGGGPDNEYSTAINWDDNTVPVGGTSAQATRDINNGDTVVRSVNSTAGRTFVSGGSTLNVTGGTHSDNRSGNTIRNFVGRGSPGTVNQSAGSYNIGHMISIGGGGANGHGAFNVTGGSLAASRGANAANLPSGVVGGYSLEVGDNDDGNGGSGLFEISGGSFETRIGVAIGGTGTFSVVGSNHTAGPSGNEIGIGSNGSLDGEWNQFSGGTLSFAIDGGGVTSVFVDDVDGGGVSVNFQSGSLLDLSFFGTPETSDTWTLLTAENSAITDGGLSLAPGVDSGWSFTVDNSGTNGVLTATYLVAIPEPGAFLMLSAVALLVAYRKHSRGNLSRD